MRALKEENKFQFLYSSFATLNSPFRIFKFPKCHFSVKVITPPGPNNWSDPLKGSECKMEKNKSKSEFFPLFSY